METERLCEPLSEPCATGTRLAAGSLADAGLVAKPFALKRSSLALLLLTWLLIVGGGSLWMISYSQTPGKQAAAPQQLPKDLPITLQPGQATLLMFVHPHCPCSRASLSELERLLARCQPVPDTHLIFFKAAEMPEEWSESAIVQEARSIPGVTIRTDEDGALASRFHAETSGQVLLYDEAAELVFAGGITASRGHEGGNAGSDAIAVWVNGNRKTHRETPVFGCGLVTSKPQTL